jgi:hypothetical protein
VTLRATLTTNGVPGTIRYEWLRPDGRRAGSGQVAVRGGQRSVTVTLAVDYEGNAPAQGADALHVTAPASVYSEPLMVGYACP